MATTLQSDFQIRDPRFEAGLQETLDYEIGLFNAGSNGAIRLITRSMLGNYTEGRYMNRMDGLVNHRDITSLAAVADQKITESSMYAVKLNRRVGPIAYTLDSIKKRGLTEGGLYNFYGSLAGEAIREDYLSTAIISITAALSQETSGTDQVVYDHTGTGTMEPAALIAAKRLWGDRAGQSGTLIMHSKAYWDLVGNQFSTGGDTVAGTILYGGTPGTLGLPVVVTDSPALVLTDAGGVGIDHYVTLFLKPGAVTVIQSEPRTEVLEVISGLENLVKRYQGEHAFNIDLMGYSWDVTNGGVNPDDSALALASNWDALSTNAKDLPGLYIVTT